MSKSRRNRSGKNKGELSNTYLPGDIDGKDLQKGSVVIGLGEVYAAPSKDKQSHECKININPEAVKRSFDEFKDAFKTKLHNSIDAFYQSDHNKYNVVEKILDERTLTPVWSDDFSQRRVTNFTIGFDVNVIPSRLSATTFTYIYQFELSYDDGEYKAHMVNNLQKLNDCLRTFEKDLYNAYIEKIPKGHYPSTKLNFQQLIQFCNSYGIKTIQERAPIISAENGKFNLTQVDISQLTQNVLCRHARISRHMKDGSLKEDNKYDEAVFERYCKGQSDAQIAFRRFLWENAKEHPFRHLIKALTAWGLGVLYGPTPIIAQFNSAITLAVGKDIAGLIGDGIDWIRGKFGKEKSWGRHFQTKDVFNKENIFDKINNRDIPMLDIVTAVLGTDKSAMGEIASERNAKIGSFSEVCQIIRYAATQLKVELDSLDVPKAMNDIDPIELLLPDIFDFLSKKIKIELEGGGFLEFGEVQKASYTKPYYTGESRRSRYIEENNNNNNNMNKTGKGKKRK